MLGGAAINTGTIPSKALREAVLHLTGASYRGLFGESYRVKQHITVSDLVFVSEQVIRHELELIRSHFDRNDVELVWGEAHFVSPNLLEVTRPDDSERSSAEVFVIATGTRPARPESVPFNDQSVFCSDSLLKLNHLPKTMIVVGGGVIGTEYACMLATVGRQGHARRGPPRGPGIPRPRDHRGVPVPHAADGHHAPAGREGRPDRADRARIRRAAARASHARIGQGPPRQTLLYCVGRQGTTGALQLENVNLAADDRQRLKVNGNYQTEVEHIYAAGDVIGFPALASTAMEQGRLAVCHAFGAPTNSMPDLFPFGIYAIPEISMVGKTEDQLTDAGIPYEAGIAQYKELARGQLLGDDTGMLKLLIHQENHQILGVHAIGTNATELIHIGQAVMAFNGTVDYFINNVFNFPTLAEAYKVAALNGLNKLRHV